MAQRLRRRVSKTSVSSRRGIQERLLTRDKHRSSQITNMRQGILRIRVALIAVDGQGGGGDSAATIGSPEAKRRLVEFPLRYQLLLAAHLANGPSSFGEELSP